MCAALKDTSIQLSWFLSIEELCAWFSNVPFIMIDIPIGLPESKESAFLRPDSLLRRALKGKASCVFNTPCRQAVYAPNKQEAKEQNKLVLGKDLSEQSLGILPSIRQVDTFLRTNVQWGNRLLESHPEYGFSLLNAGQPVLEKKRKPEGTQKRLQLLEPYVSNCDLAVKRQPYRDDAVDAICLAVIGKIGSENGFRTIPTEPTFDDAGLPMQIVGI